MHTTRPPFPRVTLCTLALVPVLACTGNVDYSQIGSGKGGSGTVRTGSGGAGSSVGSMGSGGSGSASGGATGTGASGTGGSAATGTGGANAVTADPNAAGLLPLRRLTAREYLNTVRDLLGDATTLASDDVPGEADDLSNNAFPFRQPTVIATSG